MLVGLLLRPLPVDGAESVDATSAPPAAESATAELIAEGAEDSPGLSAAAPGAAVPRDGGGVARSSSAARQIEEIVVSARKREEALEDTPVSVTALGPRQLVAHGVTRLDDIEEMVPNLTFQQTPEGQDALVRIRGVGTPRASVQFDPGVGIYVDGVFLARAAGGLIDVLDIEQIEVLRGPQGTLFGKNTVGGALNISTVRPHEELEGFVLVRPGNFASVNARLMLNVPLVEERLFSRVAVSIDRSDGYVLNLDRDEYLSNRDAVNFVGSLRYLATENLVIDLTGTWSRSRSRGRGGRCAYVQPTGLQGLSPDWAPDCRASEPFRVEANVAQLANVDTYGAWATLRWDIGPVGLLDDLSLKSITSWREQAPSLRNDSDGTALDLVEIAEVGGPPLSGLPGFARQVSEELQVNGEALDGRLAFVGGAFGYWEKSDYGRLLVAFPGILDNFTQNEVHTDNWNWALYGQATFEPTEWLSLTAGLRYTTEKKELSALNLVMDPATGEPVTGPAEFQGSGSRKFSAWTPMATAAFSVPESFLDTTRVDHLMAYFTYARGFRGGGFNALGATTSEGAGNELEPFAPEYLDSFEVGLKATGLEQRIMLNFSLFLSQYDDIQVTSIREIGGNEAGEVPDVIQLTLNAASATAKGFELELRAVPVDGLQVTGSVGLVDARYDEFIGISDLTNQPIDRAGETFNNTPKWQTFLAAQYSLPVDGAGNRMLAGWVTPRIEWAYRSAVHYTGPEVAQATQQGFNLLNARLSYDFFDERAQVALWGKNLTNEGYFDTSTPIANFFGITLQYYELPRTFGAELSYRF